MSDRNKRVPRNVTRLKKIVNSKATFGFGFRPVSMRGKEKEWVTYKPHVCGSSTLSRSQQQLLRDLDSRMTRLHGFGRSRSCESRRVFQELVPIAPYLHSKYIPRVNYHATRV